MYFFFLFYLVAFAFYFYFFFIDDNRTRACHNIREHVMRYKFYICRCHRFLGEALFASLWSTRLCHRNI